MFSILSWVGYHENLTQSIDIPSSLWLSFMDKTILSFSSCQGFLFAWLAVIEALDWLAAIEALDWLAAFATRCSISTSKPPRSCCSLSSRRTLRPLQGTQVAQEVHLMEESIKASFRVFKVMQRVRWGRTRLRRGGKWKAEIELKF